MNKVEHRNFHKHSVFCGVWLCNGRPVENQWGKCLSKQIFSKADWNTESTLLRPPSLWRHFRCSQSLMESWHVLRPESALPSCHSRLFALMPWCASEVTEVKGVRLQLDASPLVVIVRSKEFCLKTSPLRPSSGARAFNLHAAFHHWQSVCRRPVGAQLHYLWDSAALQLTSLSGPDVWPSSWRYHLDSNPPQSPDVSVRTRPSAAAKLGILLSF